MRRVIYRSRPLTTPWPSTILDIARTAEQHNVRAGISGLLLFAADSYLQYLEGEDGALANLWDLLQKDDRHAIVWHHEREIERFEVPGLPMGFVDADRESGFAAAAKLWSHRHDWPLHLADSLAEMLVGVAREKYPALAAPTSAAAANRDADGGSTA